MACDRGARPYNGVLGAGTPARSTVPLVRGQVHADESFLSFFYTKDEPKVNELNEAQPSLICWKQYILLANGGIRPVRP